MSSTQASYPRSPLVDAFTPLINSNASGGATPSSSSTRGGSGPIPNEMTSVPAKSCSSSLRPPSSTGSSKPTSASARASTLQQRNARPLSEVIRPENFMSPETEALDKWFEDLQEYEQNLESMASASLDTRFKDEMNHVDQWFMCLNEAERTAMVYSLLQHSSQVQIRFFITVLQQMAKKDPVGSLLSPAHPEKSDMMQTQLAGAMAKAELEANQKLLSSRTYRRQQQPRHQADEQQLLRSYGADYLTAQRSTTPAASGFMDDVFMPQPRLRPQSASTMNRPRSVIEGGDLSSIFNNNGGGWSFKQAGGMVASGAAGGGRPKSADISNWSFGLGGTSSAETAPTWGALSPTVSTFSERGKTIERPNSASDIDQHVPSVLSGGNWGSSRNVLLSEDTARFPRRRGGQTTSDNNNNNNNDTIPETDERQQVADIVLSMYDDDDAAAARDGAGPLPQKSTSTSSAHALRSSPVPSSSNSATLSPYWEATRSPRHPPTANGFGRYLNPNDRLQDPDYDYLSDHSESSNVSARRHQQQHHHSRYNNNNNQHRKKSHGQRGGGGGSGGKEKKYTDAVDMELLQDIPAWLRSLRLHKYNSIFEYMKWQDMIRLDDEQLSAKGVAALGARRKMLKVFEQVKQHCEKNNIPLE
ncbi:rna-binding protein involved in translationalpartial [Lichtheimia corymbifera JMRC:FSU:9682]|uniref:RNA-binding protein VTS1 n=1 Tax=Lichtheimia corymbifera JMRC:FSU:9682 TaxID=1263082 RepID=A0A068RIL1_9FUNG|nr:rna-binding protein involved in translationalpartial [Lichtheimia corymbifera JMRC:FSU:9682]